MLKIADHPAKEFGAKLDEVGVAQRATTASAKATKAADNLSAWSPCVPPVMDAATCESQLIDWLGKWTFRRPLAEAGEMAGQVVPLGDYALASRLSFFLWDSPPDDSLLADAGLNKLTDGAGLDQQVQRMLADVLHGMVSARDREVVDAHLTALRNYEAQVAKASNCDQPVHRPVPSDTDSVRSGADVKELCPLYMDFALPNVLLGGAGGYSRMGRLQLPATNPTQVLISIASSMGVAVPTLGEAPYVATAPLSGLV